MHGIEREVRVDPASLGHVLAQPVVAAALEGLSAVSFTAVRGWLGGERVDDVDGRSCGVFDSSALDYHEVWRFGRHTRVDAKDARRLRRRYPGDYGEAAGVSLTWGEYVASSEDIPGSPCARTSSAVPGADGADDEDEDEDDEDEDDEEVEDGAPLLDAAGGDAVHVGGEDDVVGVLPPGPYVLERHRQVRTRLWLTQQHPLSVAHVLPVLEVMSPGNRHFAMLRQFLSSNLPGGERSFPVRVEMPLHVSVHGEMHFSAYEAVVDVPEAAVLEGLEGMERVSRREYEARMAAEHGGQQQHDRR